MQEKSHKLAAIVFTDIVGYTKQMEENEQQTMQLLQEQKEIIFPLVESYGGEVIKEIGDGLLIMFGSAVEAVRFATTAQNRLKDEKLTIRAGIHIGDVIFKEGDVFGSAVNTAARIEPLAPPNGICISDDVRNQLKNKSDIQTISLGKKDLKGVKESVEIFEVFIEGISDWQKKSIAWFFKDLWSRMVIQILAGYLVSSWIIKQAVSAIAARYLLSPHLVDLAWVILLSLLPTVFLLTYFHGKRKTTKWTNTELVGFPANIAFTLLMVIFLFKGKDLGATTKSINVENEKGETVEHIILKSEFRKKIALFFFENESKNPEHDWYRCAIPLVASVDLLQDIYIDVTTTFKFNNKLTGTSFTDGFNLPFTLMKKLAEQDNKNYFLTGSFNIDGGNYIIHTKLYETARGKLLAENSFTGTNIFDLTDQITLTIKEDIEIPKNHIEETNDLPIADLYTSSLEALQFCSQSYYLKNFKNDYTQGIQYMKQAIEIDPGFAVAQLMLTEFYFKTGEMDEARVLIQAAMNNLYKLPERSQYKLKFAYYLLNEEPDKALAVIKMWIELFPDDLEGRIMLAERYNNNNERPKAIKAYKTVLELDPKQYSILLDIGYIYQNAGIPDSAIYYFKLYANQLPKDYKSFYFMGLVYITTGEYDLAKQSFEKAILLEPGELFLQIQKGGIDTRTGDIDQALTDYERILLLSKSAKDSSIVFSYLSDLYLTKGQPAKSLDYHLKSVEVSKKFKSPLQVDVKNIFEIKKYITAGREKRGI